MLRLEARNVGNTKIKMLNGCFFYGELGVSSLASWARGMRGGGRRQWRRAGAGLSKWRRHMRHAWGERRGRLMREEAMIWIWIQQLWLRERISNTGRWEIKKSERYIGFLSLDHLRIIKTS